MPQHAAPLCCKVQLQLLDSSHSATSGFVRRHMVRFAADPATAAAEVRAARALRQANLPHACSQGRRLLCAAASRGAEPSAAKRDAAFFLASCELVTTRLTCVSVRDSEEVDLGLYALCDVEINGAAPCSRCISPCLFSRRWDAGSDSDRWRLVAAASGAATAHSSHSRVEWLAPFARQLDSGCLSAMRRKPWHAEPSARHSCCVGDVPDGTALPRKGAISQQPRGALPPAASYKVSSHRDPSSHSECMHRLIHPASARRMADVCRCHLSRSLAVCLS
jgi:hypothetical protein